MEDKDVKKPDLARPEIAAGQRLMCAKLYACYREWVKNGRQTRDEKSGSADGNASDA